MYLSERIVSASSEMSSSNCTFFTPRFSIREVNTPCRLSISLFQAVGGMERRHTSSDSIVLQPAASAIVGTELGESMGPQLVALIIQYHRKKKETQSIELPGAMK